MTTVVFTFVGGCLGLMWAGLICVLVLLSGLAHPQLPTSFWDAFMWPLVTGWVVGVLGGYCAGRRLNR